MVQPLEQETKPCTVRWLMLKCDAMATKSWFGRCFEKLINGKSHLQLSTLFTKIGSRHKWKWTNDGKPSILSRRTCEKFAKPKTSFWRRSARSISRCRYSDNARIMSSNIASQNTSALLPSSNFCLAYTASASPWFCRLDARDFSTPVPCSSHVIPRVWPAGVIALSAAIHQHDRAQTAP